MQRSFSSVFAGVLLIGVLPSTAVAQCDVETFRAPYQIGIGYFGGWVDVSGDLAVASGRNGNDDRAAFLFERGPSGWFPTQEVTSGALVTAYATSLALDGTTLMLSNIDTDAEAGSVLVFERSAAGFQLNSTLQPASTIADSHFGRRIAIDGDRAVIAAPMDAHFFQRGGAVFVFERALGTWVETARIDPPTPRSFGFFGLAVAIEGDLLVVGEPGYVVHSSINYVYVYRLIGGVWTLEDVLAPRQGIGFGYAVDIDDGRIVVGAFRDNAWGGTVWEYARVGGIWEVQDSIRGIDVGLTPGFGKDVEFDGGRLVVGAGSPEIGGGGPVIVMQRSLGSWAVEAVLSGNAPPGWSSGFGPGIALSDNDVWVGAVGESPPGLYCSGRSYAFELGATVASYCAPTTPNSTGALGRLRTTGCGTLGNNDLVLEAFDLPPFSLGMFLVARQPGFAPFGAASQGNLCLSGVTGRYVAQAGSTGASGTLQLGVDVTNLPPNGTGAMLGESLYFQVWYRDANPQQTSNATQGLAIVVQ
jgi:hypothetical protein